MIEVTDAVELAWQVAADETLQSGATSIEPFHLLIGVCSIGKFLERDAWHRTRFKASALGPLKLEWQNFVEILSTAGVDYVALRRAVRKELGHTDRKDPLPTKMSRSQASRVLFDRAEQLAQGVHAGVIGLIHLFIAMLESDEQSLSEFFKRERLDAVELRSGMDRAAETKSPIPSLAAPVAGNTDDARASHNPLCEDLPRISVSMDASLSPFVSSAAGTQKARLALFYELPLQFGAEAGISSLLNKVVQEIVKLVPGAERAALLVKDRETQSLLLRAHVPEGGPAVSLTLAERAMQMKQGFIWDHRGEVLSPSLMEKRSEAGMYAPLLWHGQTLGVLCVDSCKHSDSFEEDDLRLLVAVAHHAAMAIATNQLQEDLRQKSTLLERLLTNFSPRIRDKLLEKARHGRLVLGGEKSEVTILFSDIRGFTGLSATMDAEDVMEMLNHYFSALVETIFRYDGTIDKFIGDSILAVFGSPEPDPNQHVKAVHAALEMQAAMTARNQLRLTTGRPVCQIGIGVHCGEVLHGFIGSPDRMEFTVVGDPVNRAARYCAGAQPGEVLISSDLHQRVWRHVEVEGCTIATKHEGDLSAFRVKGCRPARSV